MFAASFFSNASRSGNRQDLQNVLSLFADPLFVLRDSDKRILFCNSAAENYFPRMCAGAYASDIFIKDAPRFTRARGLHAAVTIMPLCWNGYDPATLTLIRRQTSSSVLSAARQPRTGLCSRIMEINLDSGEYMLEGSSVCTDFPELLGISNMQELYHFLLHKAHPQDKGIIHNFLNLEALRCLHDIGTPRFTCRCRLRACTGLYVPLECRAVFRQADEGGAKAVLIIRSLPDRAPYEGESCALH